MGRPPLPEGGSRLRPEEEEEQEGAEEAAVEVEGISVSMEETGTAAAAAAAALLVEGTEVGVVAVVVGGVSFSQGCRRMSSSLRRWSAATWRQPRTRS